MADLLSFLSPIGIVAALMILTGVAILAGSLQRGEALVVVMVLLAVTSFIAGRMSRDFW